MLFAGCLRAQLLSASKRGFLLGLRHKTHATSVYKEEARKLLLLNGAALVLAAFAGFGIYQGVTAESYIGPDEIYYAYYMKHTSGPFTQESYDWLEEQGEEFAPMLEVQRKVAAGELSSDAMLAFSSLQQKYSVYSRVINQNINYYLKEHPGAWLVYESGYKELFGFTGDADVQDAFLSSFVMIYLTDTVGLNPGIVGTLIAVSKLFDGITDIFFGSMIDKTHSKLGKARPWMLYGYIGCAITLVGIFAIPMGMSEFAKYAWFFICYSLLNAVFYTANNIAYSALTSLVTKNSAERVEMGSYRFMFAFATSLAIQSFTLLAVSALGDTAEAWRTVAIVYAIIGLIVNTLSVFSVKELPEEEFVDTTDKAEIEKDEKYGLVEAAKLLVSNKYYLMICVTYILQQIYGAMISMGTYYAAHILCDKNLFGVFSWAINIPLIIALVFTPTLVAKMHGMYKLNIGSYALATVARALVAVAGYTGTGDVKMMLLFTAIAALGQGPWQGDMNAVIASCSEYTWLTKHKRVDGTMYSCTSLGVKLGGGLGTAITGWLLAFSNYDKALAVQPESCINMLKLMYLVIPFVLDAIITFILSRMKVDEANDKIRAEMKN